MSAPSEGEYVRLVEPHRDELRAHCRRILGSPEAAEDAVQEAMVRAWRALPGFAGRGSMRSWLYRIATNVSLDTMRNRRHTSPSVDPRADGGPLQARPRADVEYESREALQRTMTVAIEVLPPTQLAVLILRALAGFSAAETAGMLGTTVPAVNSALQRARRTLRRARELKGRADELAA